MYIHTCRSIEYSRRTFAGCLDVRRRERERVSCPHIYAIEAISLTLFKHYLCIFRKESMGISPAAQKPSLRKHPLTHSCQGEVLVQLIGRETNKTEPKSKISNPTDQPPLSLFSFLHLVKRELLNIGPPSTHTTYPSGDGTSILCVPVYSQPTKQSINHRPP